jgi:uncharacterized protein (TIRG00374 family)
MTDLRRRLITGLVFGFLVALGLALLGDIRQVGADLLAFDWRLFPLALAGTAYNYILRYFKFHYYLGWIGAGQLPRRVSARIFAAGLPLAVTPGKVGEVMKGVWLHQACGVPIARAIPVVLAERISDGLAVIALAASGVIAYPQYWPAFAAVLILLLALIALSQIRPLALRLIGLIGRLPVLGSLAHHLGEFYEGTYALFRPKPTVTAIGLGIAGWLGEGLAFYLILIGLGVPPSWQVLSLAVFILAFSTVIGAVSALPGGLGAADVSIAGMLTLLVGLPAGTAAAATLLVRFATLWFGVGLGLIVWTRSPSLFDPAPAAAGNP